MNQQYIAAEIRAELGRQHLSQAHLALALGWTEAYLSRRLTGQVCFTLANISVIADQLGIPPSTLTGPASALSSRKAG